MTPCIFLCGLYLQLGIAALDGRAPINANDPQNNAWLHDVAQPLNPYATIEAGWSSPAWRGLNVDVAGRHMSGSGHDKGFNTAEVRVRWHPWVR